MVVPTAIVARFRIGATVVAGLRIYAAVIAGIVICRIVRARTIDAHAACHARRHRLNSATAAAGRVDHAHPGEWTGLSVGSEDECSGAERGCRTDGCEFDLHGRRLTNANVDASGQR